MFYLKNLVSRAQVLHRTKAFSYVIGFNRQISPHLCSQSKRGNLIHSKCRISVRSFSISNEKNLENQTVETIYQKKTPTEHVLLRPDTYIGSCQIHQDSLWVVEDGAIAQKSVTYVPGLYKIFDEILVNAADNAQRSAEMTQISVEIDASANRISVSNDGKGIPIQIHKTEGVYVPEMIFGHLFTGSNFDDKVLKVTGGRNGFGAKLTNIFSKEFEVEIVDKKRELSYKQLWKNNMSERSAPQIGPVSSNFNDFTKVTFVPDLEKFGIASLQGDVIGLLERRVYDVAACLPSISVSLNGKVLPNSFKDYLALYKVEREENSPRVFARINSRWEVGVGVSTSGQFSHISFVNSISTSKGGTHVNYIADQVADYLLEHIQKTQKDLHLTAAAIKNHLFVFVNCLIDNPSFDSQTKETLTTKPSQFGSRCVLKGQFLQDMLENSNIVEHIINWARYKQKAELITKSTRTRVLAIPKLYDANLAGTNRSQECTLILTEGDSAKALAVAGLAVIGRDKYGVFPLRGKLLNVRDATHSQLMNNVELNHVISILGLNYEKKYHNAEERSELRYGKIMLMVDQDHDGSHIKGLFINFLHKFWPQLLETNDFLEEFVTPIVKVSKGKQRLSFFTISEYLRWRREIPEDQIHAWHVKYYKGLGTNTAAEAKEYFSQLEKHKISFQWTSNTDELMGMAFSKDTSSQRKAWLNNYHEDDFVDHSVSRLSYSDFVNKELIHFAMADNKRSIPSLIDGLKPGQRKILYACFKRKLDSEIKVAQLAGYVSEHTAYHHGEMSLSGTIINMAQDFVGSNNIALLFPSGQFGTRLQGGEDAASPRYIFTRLSEITRHLFPEADDELLHYLEDDGQKIEPNFFVPIIPTILINGARGLGTGWSTFVPTYHPLQVIENVIRKLDNQPMNPLFPWIRGYKGTINKCGEYDFISNGVIEVVNDTTLVISELPVGKWADDYKIFLDSFSKTFLKSYSIHHTDTSIKFVLHLKKKLLVDVNKLSDIFKLSSRLSTRNMHLFDSSGCLRRYSSPLEIIESFFPVREALYQKRKELLETKLEDSLQLVANRVRFCDLVSSGRLSVLNRSKESLIAELKSLGFDARNDFDYLMNMSLWNLTQERMHKLKAEKETKEADLQTLKNSTVSSMWQGELHSLHKEISKELKHL